MSRHTAAEGRELARRLAKTRVKGGTPHEVVRREMIEDMERDLRRMVQAYAGTARQAKQLLEALVAAREAGVPACDELERELADRMRRKRAA